MPRGKIVDPKKVMPFVPPGLEGVFESRMLIDAESAGSQRLQINHCILRAGNKLPDGVHRAPYDETYIVLSGHGSLNLDGVPRRLGPGSIAFIPGGTPHGLNSDSGEDVVFFTVWPGTPEPGVNGVYDLRKEAWGTTYREV